MAKESKIYAQPYPQIFKAALDALKDCSFKVKGGDINAGKIIASTKPSIRSISGERIEIYFASKAGKVEVTMFSSPVYPLSITLGKTKENIKKFFSALEKYLGR